MLGKIFSHVLIDLRLAFGLMIISVAFTYFLTGTLSTIMLYPLVLAGIFTLLSLLATLYDKHYLARIITLVAMVFYSTGTFMLINAGLFTIANGVVIGSTFLALALGSKVYSVGFE